MKRFNRLIRSLAPALLAVAACAPARSAQGAAAQSVQDQQLPYIDVTGTGSVSVEADRARLSFAVETSATAASGAASANADLMEGVLSALRDSDVSDVESETFGYTLRPEYTFPDNDRSRPRVISAYTAINNIRVTILDIDAVGRMIDVVIDAGVNRISSINFIASDTGAARAEALAAAVESAREEAQAIADALGRALGEPLHVRGGSRVPARGGEVYAMAVSARQVAPTPIEAGDLTITATVDIRFAIGR